MSTATIAKHHGTCQKSMVINYFISFFFVKFCVTNWLLSVTCTFLVQPNGRLRSSFSNLTKKKEKRRWKIIILMLCRIHLSGGISLTLSLQLFMSFKKWYFHASSSSSIPTLSTLSDDFMNEWTHKHNKLIHQYRYDSLARVEVGSSFNYSLPFVSFSTKLLLFFFLFLLIIRGFACVCKYSSNIFFFVSQTLIEYLNA